MSPAASFAERWARDNLSRDASSGELAVLGLFPVTCEGDEAEAARRARRYYEARGPGGLTDLWHRRRPDDEDILSSCQDVYILPLRTRSVAGRRVTLIRFPAPTAQGRTISARALLTRWLMLLDIRLREDPSPGDEVVFIDVGDLQPTHIKNHFRGTYWKDFVWCMKTAYPLRITELHIINTQRLKTMALLLLHIGLYPWRRKVVHFHSSTDAFDNALGADRFPVDGLPHEYGGKAGAMRDLNDEWTKKLLSNSKWLQSEERKFYTTDLKPETRLRTRHKTAMRSIRGTIGSYNIITRTQSSGSLHRQDDLDEGIHGAYRTIKVTNDRVHL